MLSRFFIHRPIFACVISIVILLMGAVAYTRLPVAQYPELAPPIVRVEARYPGASAKVIADTVASPLEQEINGVDRMIYMSSTSADGLYQLDVSFEVGTDVDMAAVLVQNRVSVAESKLPEDVRRLGIKTAKQSTAMVGVISLSAPDGGYDDLYLTNYMTINVKDEVARIYGVGGINLLPAKDYGMRIWLDPEKLKARSLTVVDVNDAIREQNVQVAAGVIGRQPAPPGQDLELFVSTKGRLTEPHEFAEIIVKRDAGGRVVRVSDIGRVELGARDYSTLGAFNGKPAAIMPIYQLPGANLVDVAGKVEALVNRVRPNLPKGLDIQYFYDSSMFIKASLHEVKKTLLEAFVLVFLTVLVFLQSFRTTIIPTLTIPVSLIGTFLFMAVLGFSVNMLTMFGLVLAIGIVVDDAIVVVENVERVMATEHLPPKEATEKAMKEIFAPVVAITLVLMSVFVPTAALPGITGEMYRQFALTIAASTFLSAVNALTLSPALCGMLLRAHDPNHKPGNMGRIVAAPARAFNWAFDRFTSLYAFVAKGFIVIFPVSLALLAGTYFLTVRTYSSIPTGFVPNEDLGFIAVSMQLPDGASLERSKALSDLVAENVRGIEGVADVGALAGFSVLDGQGPTYANCWIILTPWDERTKSGRTIDAIIRDVRTVVAPMQEAQFLVFSLPPISGLGSAAGQEMRVLDRAGVGRDALERSLGEMLAAAAGQPVIGVAFSAYRAGVPQVYVDVDREKALKLNVSLSTIFQTLQTALGSSYVNDFNLFDRTFQVNTQAEAKFRLKAEDIENLEVRTRTGQMLPLRAMATVQDSLGPERVTRYNLYVSANVTAIGRPGMSSGQVIRAMEATADANLAPGLGYDWTTMSFQEKRTEGQGASVFVLGIILVYLILAAQYESWTAPLAVVLSIPLVIIGALAALKFRGLDNNVFTQIGLVLLIGLGAKNAILIVEFARANRAQGKSVRESALHAARTRFRPILMTSLAFILGVVPLVLAEGAGAASRRALGTAVFGGMVGSTILGLVFTPMLYVVIQTIAEWVKPPKPRPPSAPNLHEPPPAHAGGSDPHAGADSAHAAPA